MYIYNMLQNVPWIYPDVAPRDISHQAHLCLGNRDDAIGDCDQVQWRDMSWREETRSLLQGCQDNFVHTHNTIFIISSIITSSYHSKTSQDWKFLWVAQLATGSWAQPRPGICCSGLKMMSKIADPQTMLEYAVVHGGSWYQSQLTWGSDSWSCVFKGSPTGVVLFSLHRLKKSCGRNSCCEMLWTSASDKFTKKLMKHGKRLTCDPFTWILHLQHWNQTANNKSKTRDYNI